MADTTPEALHSKIKLARWPLSKLKPYAKNARRHPPEQITKLVALITKHGFDVPIVVDGNGTIIKGHGRFAAAKKAGLKEVPVVIRDDLTEAQIREARIADNRVAEFSEWDEALLGEDVRDAMKLDDFDAGILGFDNIPGLDVAKELESDDTDAQEPKEATVQSIQYTVVFDDEAQHKRFVEMLRKLKTKYPQLPTIAARLDAYMSTLAAK